MSFIYIFPCEITAWRRVLVQTSLEQRCVHNLGIPVFSKHKFINGSSECNQSDDRFHLLYTLNRSWNIQFFVADAPTDLVNKTELRTLQIWSRRKLAQIVWCTAAKDARKKNHNRKFIPMTAGVNKKYDMLLNNLTHIFFGFVLPLLYGTLHHNRLHWNRIRSDNRWYNLSFSPCYCWVFFIEYICVIIDHWQRICFSFSSMA